MHTVAVLALSDTIAFDLSTPIEVFGRVRLPGGRPGYRVQVCGPEPVVDAGPVRLAVDHGLEALDRADTVVVPGRHDHARPVAGDVLEALRAAAAAGTRIASICVGAFTLAAAGLLDGRRATTHWLAAEPFRAAFPAVDLDPDALYVDNRVHLADQLPGPVQADQRSGAAGVPRRLQALGWSPCTSFC
jgi:transcriptional regulator GlxA family with amidase domain